MAKYDIPPPQTCLLTFKSLYLFQFSCSTSRLSVKITDLLFSLAVQPSAGYGLLVTRGFLITHNDAPKSVGLLWTSEFHSNIL
jgi:hypothetical protein